MTDFATLVRDLKEAQGTVRRLLHATTDAELKLAGKGFDERAYRNLYPDIDLAMRRGLVKSALTHWREWGFKEGRAAPLLDLEPQKAPAAPAPGQQHNNYETCLLQQKVAPLAPGPRNQASKSVVIYAPRAVTPTSGGLLVLHKLCQMLRGRGVDAHLWLGEPSDISATDPYGPYANGSIDPRDSVAIYPEITCDNPLQARHVVRWLLNRPGIFNRRVAYSPHDLIVHHSPLCALDPDPALELCILTWEPQPAHPSRERTHQACYVVRKGRERPRLPMTRDALCLDDASPADIQKAFESHTCFYSYDLHTFLTVQAAMAGAISVVLPDPALSAEKWRQTYIFGRYGVAYGIEEIPRAIHTRHLIPGYLEQLERNSELQVDAFLARIEALNWWKPAKVNSNRAARSGDGAHGAAPAMEAP